MPCPVDVVLLAEMFQRHGPALELYAAQWTTASEDCVQEAFIEMARQATAPDNPRAWLYRVVRNRALNAARSAHRRAAHEEIAARLRATDVSAAPSIDAADVADALASLTSIERETVVLRVWGGLTWQETAEVTGKSSSAAERTYRAALVALRKIWESEACPKKFDCPTS